MTVRCLSLVRHGAADAFGALTEVGHRQMRLLGRRLARVPVDVVWHSPLPRAAASAHTLAEQLPPTPVLEAPELVDHVPDVPAAADTPAAWRGFFDGFTEEEAAAGRRLAGALTDRFGGPATVRGTRAATDTHEVLVTHSYPIAWLVRHSLGAPRSRWLGLDSANGALTVVEHRTGLTPLLVTFNEMSHLPAELRWTGVPATARP